MVGQVFATDQAAFLAGYLAAGMTKTGVLGTFGGINIPTVTVFMDGFVHGANYYNEKKGTSVSVLGWDPEAKEGLFTNNFESLDDGRAFAQNLYDEGADIVLPVAGPVGLGSAALADELGTDKVENHRRRRRPDSDRSREEARLPDFDHEAAWIRPCSRSSRLR